MLVCAQVVVDALDVLSDELLTESLHAGEDLLGRGLDLVGGELEAEETLIAKLDDVAVLDAQAAVAKVLAATGGRVWERKSSWYKKTTYLFRRRRSRGTAQRLYSPTILLRYF